MNVQAGFGKLEFAVVLVVFGVLATLLLNRLVALEHETERLEVDLTVRHINIGMKLAIGEHLMRAQEHRIARLLEENPLHFLGAQKVGVGETASRWRYDQSSHILNYRPRQPEAFDGRESLSWRFTGDRDNLGRAVGLRLEPLK